MIYEQKECRMKYFEVEFLGSFENVEQCPYSDLPEFAFLGRSNVGKSSLINALLNRKGIARVLLTLLTNVQVFLVYVLIMAVQIVMVMD